ncbi:MAG: outer membrane protein assembly factor BamD [Parvibaculaceae bacterium]|nr:outer membrane protein assembly factor BamD [Parvibaculaceae bacterium]
MSEALQIPQRGTIRRRPGVLSAIALVAGSLLLSACSSGKEEVAYQERPVEQIYNQAMDYVQEGNYRKAAPQFDEVERQHPYSVWARRAILMSAYSYYQTNDYDQAILAAQRYISLHPGSPDAAYAYYMVAICYYEQIVDVGRDQQTTQNALKGLEEVVRRYPASEYARDARLKIDLTRDHLAGKEMEIGRYYLFNQEYVAAINRFRIVLDKYQTTTHTPEALERVTEAYVALGVRNEAQTAAAILGYNYPGSRWYQDAYGLMKGNHAEPEVDEGSWIGRAWDSVF